MKVSLILAGCLIFYRVFLQKETFFALNRFVLLACIVISFALPIVPAPSKWALQQNTTSITSPFNTSEQNTSTFGVAASTGVQARATPEITPQVPDGFDTADLIPWVERLYWVGVIIFAINLIFQTAILLYRAYTLPFVKDGRFRIIEIAEDKAPCSFANNIFINPEKYDLETYNQIIVHEKLHVSQRHTVDILLGELAIIFLWFNPFAWLYRKDIENNLEFLTDAHLVDTKCVDLRSYQLSLLKVSVPQYPLSISTNYNQSLLKARVFKLNGKRSNLNTTWKYLFLLPLIFGFVCLLNEPLAQAKELKVQRFSDFDLRDEGFWFAVVKNDTVQFQFKRDLNDKALFGSRFPLAEIKVFTNQRERFSIVREAGEIIFEGKLSGEQGMGKYRFTPNLSFKSFLQKEKIDVGNGDDMLTYFMVGLNHSLVVMLKEEGYLRLTKNDLVPLAALQVDANFIRMLRNSGYDRVPLHDLIALKSLGIDHTYITEVRKAGYPNITINQLISFKAQHIDAKYISAVRAASGSLPPTQKITVGPANLNIPTTPTVDDPEGKAVRENVRDLPVPTLRSSNYRKQFEDMGYTISEKDLSSLKALNITPEYIKSFVKLGYSGVKLADVISAKSLTVDQRDVEMYTKAGYTNVRLSDVIAAKSLNINTSYIQLWQDAGYGLVPLKTLIPLKTFGVTPELIKAYEAAGFSKIRLEQAVALKSLGVSPDLVKSYHGLGFRSLSVNDVAAAKATGTTPGYIASLREKGYNFSDIDQYISTKKH